MHYTTFSALALAAVSIVGATPVSLKSRQVGVPSYNLQFVGGPASYNVSVPQDNSITLTNNVLSVSQIFGEGITECTFDLWMGGAIAPNAEGGIDIGPPGPVKSITCPPAQCTNLLGDCGTSGSGSGLPVGYCCPGLTCMMDRCLNLTLGPPGY